MKKFINPYRIILLCGFLTTFSILPAQTPTNYPTGPNKVDFTPVNILIYIVFPVLLVVIWVVVRRRKSREKEEDQ
jgi:heme/copper-type cytochrome/quinol oxidase subunit 2